MHEFKRGARHQRARACRAEHGGGLDQQKRPQALAAIEGRMPHTGDQTRRACGLSADGHVGEELLEQRFSLGCDPGKPGGKIHSTVVHRRLV